jgi:hypothetical protein
MSQKLNAAIAVIGIDIGKNSLHIVGHDHRSAIVLRQKWSRGQVETRLANLPPCLIGMEACVGRCYEIVGMSKTCSTIRELRDRVAEHYGKEAVQLTFCLPKRPSTDGEATTPAAAQAGYKIDLDDQ